MDYKDRFTQIEFLKHIGVKPPTILKTKYSLIQEEHPEIWICKYPTENTNSDVLL